MGPVTQAPDSAEVAAGPKDHVRAKRRRFLQEDAPDEPLATLR